MRIVIGHFRILAAVILLGLASAAASQTPRGDEPIARLRPSEIPNLPPAVRKELERRGCAVPQTFVAGGRPHNVIRGQFSSASQMDWAVLCSRAGTSSILVFRGGSVKAIAELAANADSVYLQNIGGGKIGFSRALGVASPRDIRELYETRGGAEPPPLDHDGIADIFVEKGSVVWYWREGRWAELTGAD